jgi:galactose mutarotase-like enzyme
MLTVQGGGGITVQVDVADGARITSLTSGGREWLAPGGARSPGVFVQPGSGGWDEVVPTVAACVLGDSTAFSGKVLPDHGDAWQMPWTLDSHDHTHLQTSVRLATLPITLTRRVTGTPTGLRLEWEASTDGPGPVPLAWCAHPLFTADADTRIVLPGLAPALIEEHPHRGGSRDWPSAVGAAAIKAFTAEPQSTASVVHGNGDTLTLSWDPALLPYLGLYWDGAEFTDTPVVAIEPSTAFGDSAALALDEDRIRILQPGSPFRWWLQLTAGKSTEIHPARCGTMAA